MAADDLETLASPNADLKMDLAKNFTRKALFRWAIRTFIGIVIASLLVWRYPSGKYFLYVWIPMSILSLVVILIGGNQLTKQVEGIERQLQELGDLDDAE